MSMTADVARRAAELLWRTDMENAPRDGMPVDLWGTLSTDRYLRPADMRARRLVNCAYRRVLPYGHDDWDRWVTPDGVDVSATHWRRIDTPDDPSPIPALLAERAALVEVLADTLKMVEAAHRQLGIYSNDNPRIIKARALLKGAPDV